MIKFRYAFLAIATVLMVHIVAIGAGVYPVFSWFDIPMHFFGGYAIALLGLALYEWIGSHVSITDRPGASSPYARLLLQATFVVGVAIIVGVAWEWYEFLFDQFATSMVEQYGKTQMGLADTMDDLFNDMLGAITAWYLWRNKS